MAESIHRRLAAIQKELPAIGKDAENRGLNFKYRSIDAILNAVNPLLSRHGVYLLPEVLDLTTETRSAGNRVTTAAVAKVAYRFVAGEDGSSATAVVVGEGHDLGDKAVSKALTMALKTALAQTFAISAEEDPDGAGEGGAAGTDIAGPTEGGPSAARPPAPAPSGPTPDPKPDLTPDALATARQENLDRARALGPEGIEELKAYLTAEFISHDFAKHTPEDVAKVAARLDVLEQTPAAAPAS